jgi:hypothetical protein
VISTMETQGVLFLMTQRMSGLLQWQLKNFGSTKVGYLDLLRADEPEDSFWKQTEQMLLDAVRAPDFLISLVTVRYETQTNRAKVLAALNTACPSCGYSISPAEIVRLDSERMRCLKCGKIFKAGNPDLYRKRTEGGH